MRPNEARKGRGMNDGSFPISISEAARRIGMNFRVALTLVDSEGITTRMIGRARVINRAGFNQLAAAWTRMKSNRRLARSAG